VTGALKFTISEGTTRTTADDYEAMEVDEEGGPGPQRCKFVNSICFMKVVAVFSWHGSCQSLSNQGFTMIYMVPDVFLS
jgi:hypothetical protein